MADSTQVAMPIQRQHRLADVVSLKGIRGEVKKVEGFNAKFAVVLTQGVGTMACAYLFAVIALTSLPATLVAANVIPRSDVPNFLTKPGLILIISWVAQTFIQLVLLSVIMVGQGVQGAASDARAINTYNDTLTILDRLDTHTEGGLKDVLDKLDQLAAPAK